MNQEIPATVAGAGRRALVAIPQGSLISIIGPVAEEPEMLDVLWDGQNADMLLGRGIIERMRAEWASIPNERNGSGSVRVTTSAGLALLDADVTVEQSIEHADKALYLAKSGGRDRTVIWDVAMV